MNTAVSARHSFGIRSAWRLFTGSPIVFSVKVFAAGLLALYVALALGLDQPGWALATVYIVTQPLAGAVLAKSLYRFAGTLAGGLFILVAVPGLVDALPLLILAFALWMGACCFWRSGMERPGPTPSSWPDTRPRSSDFRWLRPPRTSSAPSSGAFRNSPSE